MPIPRALSRAVAGMHGNAACDLAGRNMNQEEWDALGLDGNYVRHCADYPSGDGASADAEIWMFTFDGIDTGEGDPGDQ